MNRYSAWRYILMIAIVVLGIIYAAPNLYGDDPAIEVSTKDSSAIPAELQTSVATALNKQNIPYLSSKLDKNELLIRFKNTDDQLKAQDIIQATIGNNYSVALNLAPRTPRWLQILGANPMRLGLDLRGGIHFLLQVDLNSMLTDRIASDLQSIGNSLRDANIRYTGIAANAKNVITIRFADAQAQSQALDFLNKNYSTYQFNSVAGDFTLQGSLSPNEILDMQQNAVSQNIGILRNRVNELGVAEPVIQQQGKDDISVDLPGIQDSARAKDMIGKVATIRFQLVDSDHDADQAANTGNIPFGDTLYQFEGHPVLLKDQVVLHGSSIYSASTMLGQDGRPAVNVRAGGNEISSFQKITAANVGKGMATIYTEAQPYKQIVNGKVVTDYRNVEKIINIATIQSALPNVFQITGLDSMQYAQNLALLLRSGAYTAHMAFIQERVVGPSLGNENIRSGIMSCIVGSLAVIVFMAFYYRLFGLIADLALVLDVILLVAVMSILGFTMTLPGIAGIVLTVGMAVDANVLINERIREELRNGMSPHASIHAGYERAFSTIVDANVSTLIVAAVLFALGTGPVQGFAVTLTIGLLISMVTAIFFTRGIVNLIYGGRRIKHLSIGIHVPNDTQSKYIGA